MKGSLRLRSLHFWLRKAGLRQVDLAKAIGSDQRQVSRWCRLLPASPCSAAKVAAVLDVSIEQLVRNPPQEAASHAAPLAPHEEAQL